MSEKSKHAKARGSGPALNPPTAGEAAAIEVASDRVQCRYSPVRVKVETKGKSTRIGPDHANEAGYGARIMDALGTRSGEFAETELRRLLKALGPNNSTTADQTTLNAALAVVDGIRPENEIEAMLASQMALTHVLAMQAMARAHWANMIPEYQTAGNFAIKLARTFTLQMEALAKLRRGGEQKVTVEHVHVHAGGQAIVGTVETRGREGERK